MIVVLADDLTGAAEMGGIAFRYGLAAEIQTVFNPVADADLIVVDTDTRGCSTEEAAQRVAVVAEQCRQAGVEQVFKKVDSVLRGPVLAELLALLDTLGRDQALLAPTNPSLGRTIEQGQYRLNGRPLDQTDFANDPTYPATTAEVRQMLLQRSGLASTERWPVQVMSPSDVLPGRGIIIAEAVSPTDLASWTDKLNERTIPAGAADFFAAFLAAQGYKARVDESIRFPLTGSTLFVCGSTSAASHLFCQRCEAAGMPVVRMPPDLLQQPLHPADLIQQWTDETGLALQDSSRAVIAIDRPVEQTPGLSQFLTEQLSTVVKNILATYPIDHLLVEGGATAAALVQRLGWQQLRVQQELAPGVVCVQILGQIHPSLTMKPGSYSWPLDVASLIPKQ